MNVNTMSGFSLDNCDILSNFIPIAYTTSVYDQCFLFDIALHSRDLWNCPPLGFPLVAFTAFSGTIRLSFAFLPLFGCMAYRQFFSARKCWLSHVDALSLHSMIGSSTPQQHPKSRHIDKLMFCLPPTQQRRPTGIKFISVLDGYCLTVYV